MDIPLFDQIEHLVRALAPTELGDLRSRSHRRGVKVWFETTKAPRDHYEAQLLGRAQVDGVDGMALEIGFHSEHGDSATNQAVLDDLLTTQSSWRGTLGAEAQAAVFFGAPNWRRISETWIDPDLDDPDLAFEVASRLVDYLSALEPHRR
ncbi:MAG: hypothetical protein ACC660_06515 [Acidimicrobiales bacterium]